MARQVARRHQRERIAGVAVVCLGIAVLVVALIALRQPNGHVAAASGDSSNVARQSGSPSATSPGRPSTSASSSVSAPSAAELKSVPLVVLNNSPVVGLATKASQQYKSAGWTVTSVDNLQNDIISSCAYYDPSVPNARAAALALQQQFPAIKRVKPKFPELPSGPVVVVLTSDYSTT
jgi:LytR cell envelope-related transcriptional attenuator